ncbi:nuclear transport factor 2 family protein [Rhodotorula paludigena]|uniref:nuclear transport factor 2 family protein n=1 Tax=Rhodotorula paludigena TaxID=86838 RepID=UPI0031734CF3
MGYSDFSAPASLPQAKRDFLAAFYRTSDQPDAIDDYLAFLAPDVDFIMGLNAVRGHQAVRKIRENMWGGVQTRRHQPHAVFVQDARGDGDHDDGARQLMLHGTVDYGLRNGKTVDAVGWAALVVFADSDGTSELKMKRYQDGAPLAKALAEQAAEQQQQ